MVPTIEMTAASIKIKYGPVLHFHCRRSDILAVQSWKWNEASAPKHARFTIQYTLTGGVETTCEYDTEEHWVAILARLEELLT